MDSNLSKLLSISSQSIAPFSAPLDRTLLAPAEPRADEFLAMLKTRNGFYAFESALHVFPLTDQHGIVSLQLWNSSSYWRNNFGRLTEGHLFFAEDIFGMQFSFKDGRIHTFNPESAKAKVYAGNIEEWAAKLLADFEVDTGFPLAHDWQMRNGALPANRRLIPKLPFVAGGQYTLDNLYLADPADAMRFRGDLAQQIHHLPDGAKIRIELE